MFQQIVDVIKLYITTESKEFVVIFIGNFFETFKMPAVNLKKICSSGKVKLFN